MKAIDCPVIRIVVAQNAAAVCMGVCVYVCVFPELANLFKFIKFIPEQIS